MISLLMQMSVERTYEQHAGDDYLEAHNRGDWTKCVEIAERMGWWHRLEAAETRLERNEPAPRPTEVDSTAGSADAPANLIDSPNNAIDGSAGSADAPTEPFDGPAEPSDSPAEPSDTQVSSQVTSNSPSATTEPELTLAL